MAKYLIKKEFFPFNYFKPPISEGFLKIYKNGNLIEIKKLRHDVYAAKNGIKFKSSTQSSQ